MTRAAILAGLLALLAGCHKAAQHAAASGHPVRGGTLVYATDREPICLDPHVGGDMPQVFVAEQYLDSLVSMDEHGAIGPWLATSWTVSPDGLSYLFHLRHDVVFTDNTPFTADAVKANLDHMANPATQSSTAGGYIRQYAGTTIVDRYTALVHLSSPYAAFLDVLAQGFLGIESPTALRRPRDQNCQEPVGSGPFRIKQWDRQNEIVFERNPSYRWAPPTARHDGPAWLDRIEWKIIPEASVRFGSLQAGEVDVIEDLPPEDETPARANPELSLLEADRPGNPTAGTMNIRRPPFDDIRVREAFTRSADIDGALGSVFFHHYRRAGGPLSPSTPDYSPDFEHSKDYDPRRAAVLLDQAGWTGRDADGYRTRNGRRLVVHVPEPATMWEADRNLWEQVQATERASGFDMRLEPSSLASVYARQGAWDYDLVLGYWNTNTADVMRIVFSSQFLGAAGIGHSHQNGSGFSDPVFDALAQQALQTQDPAQRVAIYHRMQAIVASQYLQVTTYPQSTRLGIFRTAHGVRLEPSLRVTSLYDAWVIK